MSKTIKINDFEERQLNLAIKRRENGDYLGALNLLNALNGASALLPVRYKEIAKIYMDLSLIRFALDYWFKFLSVAPKCDRAEAYNGIAACYFHIGDLHLAGFYYEKFMNEAEEKDYDYLDERIDYYTAITEKEEPSYEIIHPLEKAPSDKLIKAADKAFYDQQTEQALNYLKAIPKKDENYLSARLRLIGFEVIKGNFEKAKNYANGLISDFPNDSLPLINKLVLLADFASSCDKKEADDLVDEIKKLDVQDFQELYKATTSCIDLNKDEDALYFGEKALAAQPYSLAANFAVGAVLYNLGDYKEAEKRITVAYQLSNSSVAKYYIKACRNPEILKGARIGYDMLYPDDVAKKFTKKAYEYGGRIPKITARNGEIFKDVCDWVFSFPNDLQEDLAVSLLRSDDPSHAKYVKEKLLESAVIDEVKISVLEELTLMEEKGYLCFTCGGNYFKVKLSPLTDISLESQGAIVKYAHALAVAKTAILFKSGQKKLTETAYWVYEKLKKNGNLGKIKDENALAVAIIAFALYGLKEGASLKNASVFSMYFDTSERKINTIVKYIKADDDNN